MILKLGLSSSEKNTCLFKLCFCVLYNFALINLNYLLFNIKCQTFQKSAKLLSYKALQLLPRGWNFHQAQPNNFNKFPPKTINFHHYHYRRHHYISTFQRNQLKPHFLLHISRVDIFFVFH